MVHASFAAFENRLQKMAKHRGKLARRQGIQAFRVYDKDLNDFPFSLDLYDDKICFAVYSKNETDIDESFIQLSLDIIARVFQLPVENIFIRERKRMDHRNTQYEKLNFEKHFFQVEENGLHFLINLTDYLDTGLFLDHRITRKMVMDLAAGKRVLNLFCYTGSFSVYAAAGHAASVQSVDLSHTYLEWAEKNFTINGFSSGKNYSFIRADVIQYLQTLAPHSFDLVIMDPPTFSNSKKMKGILDIQADHVSLINGALQALSDQGVLIFSTNYRRFKIDTANMPHAQIKDITRQTTPFDFEGKLKRYCYKIEKKVSY